MKIEHEIKSIEPFERDEDGCVGLVDLIFRLKGEDRYLDTHLAIEARVYFTDSSMSIEQITTEAPLRALTLLSHLLEHSTVPANAQELQSRWK